MSRYYYRKPVRIDGVFAGHFVDEDHNEPYEDTLTIEGVVTTYNILPGLHCIEVKHKPGDFDATIYPGDKE